MSGEPSRERIPVQVDDRTANLVRWSTRTRWLALGGFWILLGCLLVVGWRFGEGGSALIIVGGLLILGHLPVFDVEGTERFVTDKPPETVRTELGDVVNPFTHGWVLAADKVFEATESDDFDVLLERQPAVPLWSTQRIPLWVSNGEDGENEFVFQDEAAGPSLRVGIAPGDDETGVTLTALRPGISAVTFLVFRLTNPLYLRRLRHHGYRRETGSGEIGLSL